MRWWLSWTMCLVHIHITYFKEARRATINWFCWNVEKEKKKVKLLSRVQLFETPWTVAHQAPPSMGFSRQEYWSGLPFPSPGDLPDPGFELVSSMLQVEDLPSEPPGMFSHTIKNSCLTNVFRICGQNFNSSCNGIIFIFLIYIYIYIQHSTLYTFWGSAKW